MSLVAKLQLYVQRVNNSLEETSHQLLLSLPKIMRDTKNLQEEALTLKHKMSTVHNEILQIEHDTGSTIKKIEQLDNLKTQFQTAKQALHESDNWIVLGAFFSLRIRIYVEFCIFLSSCRFRGSILLQKYRNHLIEAVSHAKFLKTSNQRFRL